MEVDPIKPTVKALGTKRLKLKHDELLSIFAFNLDLRRYTVAGRGQHAQPRHARVRLRVAPGRPVHVDPMKLMLKAPGTKRLRVKYDKLLSRFAFKFNLCRYNLEPAAGAAPLPDAALGFLLQSSGVAHRVSGQARCGELTILVAATRCDPLYFKKQGSKSH